jgi:hypothetical protein
VRGDQRVPAEVLRDPDAGAPEPPGSTDPESEIEGTETRDGGGRWRDAVASGIWRRGEAATSERRGEEEGDDESPPRRSAGRRAAAAPAPLRELGQGGGARPTGRGLGLGRGPGGADAYI